MQNICDAGHSHRRDTDAVFCITNIWLDNYFTHESENKYVLKFISWEFLLLESEVPWNYCLQWIACSYTNFTSLVTTSESQNGKHLV